MKRGDNNLSILK